MASSRSSSSSGSRGRSSHSRGCVVAVATVVGVKVVGISVGFFVARSNFDERVHGSLRVSAARNMDRLQLLCAPRAVPQQLSFRARH